MKKILSILSAVSLLAAMLVVAAIPVSAASPAVSEWYAVQETTCPTHTHAWFEKGRIKVESIVNGSEPGAATILYTTPIDMDNFEISFSLDKYVKCPDQYIAMGFINKGTNLIEEAALGAWSDPFFHLMLRPTDEANVIDHPQGLLANYDVERKKIRVGHSNFAPGLWFDGSSKASWSNVVFKVAKNTTGEGYDVSINGEIINKAEQNKWTFVNDIEKATGSDKWYFFVQYKDGNYAPASYTIKTINGQPAVDKSATGFMKNSLLLEGEKVADGVNNAPTTTKPADKTTTAKPDDNKTTTAKPDDNKTTAAGTGTTDTTNPSGTDVTDPSGTDVTDPSSGEDTSPTVPNSGTQADDNDQQTDGDKGGSLTWLWIVLGVVVVAGAGVAIALVVMRKKKA